MAIVSDNASNNDSMMIALEAQFQQHKIPFSAAHARIRCLPHIINLAATKVGVLLYHAATSDLILRS
jgi:hypothetical protein